MKGLRIFIDNTCQLQLRKLQPLNVAEVLAMRQVLVFRIHTDSRLVLTKLMRCEVSFEDKVVTFVTSHIQLLNIVNLLVTVLI